MQKQAEINRKTEEANQEPTEKDLPQKELKSDEIQVYMQKNLDLKSKIKILKKDVELWKTNYNDFQEELST